VNVRIAYPRPKHVVVLNIVEFSCVFRLLSTLCVELLNNTMRRHTSKGLCLSSAGVKETSVGPSEGFSAGVSELLSSDIGFERLARHLSVFV